MAIALLVVDEFSIHVNLLLLSVLSLFVRSYIVLDFFGNDFGHTL